jgi:lysophospholipase L1-like esterase
MMLPRPSRLACLLACTLVLTGALRAQDASGRLPAGEAGKLYGQIAEWMESTSVVVPELARAGAPLAENVRQSARLLRAGPTRENSVLLYKLIANARIYLQVADVVPKPAAFEETIGKQLGELRAAVARADAHFRATLDRKDEQLRASDRDNLARYAEANRELGQPAPNEKRVVFLGDSITDGWPINQYFPGASYINRGIGGQITGQMLGRMKADVLDLKPAAVVVLAGTNDIARDVAVETIKGNLSMIADLLVAYDIKPVFASVLPVSDYHKDRNPDYERTPYRPPATILELNQWLKEMCRKREFVYLDYFSAMADGKGQLKAELADDGLHPNAEGYKIMTPLAHSAIAEALKAPPPEPRKKKFGIF